MYILSGSNHIIPVYIPAKAAIMREYNAITRDYSAITREKVLLKRRK